MLAHPKCQRYIGEAMGEDALRRKANPGKYAPVKFIVNAGDNFYPAGIEEHANDKWESMWGEKYAHPGLPPGLKWYGVYGNHDYGQANKECSCSLEHDGSECAQVRRRRPAGS